MDTRADILVNDFLDLKVEFETLKKTKEYDFSLLKRFFREEQSRITDALDNAFDDFLDEMEEDEEISLKEKKNVHLSIVNIRLGE